MGIKILFLVPYPLKTSPSQRFRFEQYFSLLNSAGIEYKVSSFLHTSNGRIFSASGRVIRKTVVLLQGYLRRLADIFRATRYTFIFVHREASPLGPPVFEWILRYVLQKKIIYD